MTTFFIWKIFMYQSERIPLRWPIGSISEVTINLLTHGQHKRALEGIEKETTNTVAYQRFISESCGLKLDDVENMKIPDFNKLRLKLADIVNNGTSFFIKDKDVFTNNAVTLLSPFENDAGQLMEKVKIEVPDLKTVKWLHNQPEDQQQIGILLKCTNLSPTEIERLCVPDYNEIVSRLDDFLNQSADFFL